MPKSQVEVCVLCCCTPQIHHRLISCSLCEDTVFLCVGDSLEKTTWGLRKREAGKREDRGCAPPPIQSFLPVPSECSNTSLFDISGSESVQRGQITMSFCDAAIIGCGSGGGTGVYQESHTLQVLPKKRRQKMTQKRKLRSGLQLN